jgi:crotonyl-CoA carboxylase/reductase
MDTEELSFEDEGTLVKELMHRGLICCSPQDTVGYVAKLMLESGIHAVVVMENEEAIGVVSQTDIVLARQGKTAAQARTIPVGATMTKGCASCDANTTLTEAISTMTGLRIHRLVVTEQMNGRNVPVGVISTTDIVRKFIVES